MPRKLSVGRIFEFSSSHWLPEHPHCGLIHGHNYRMKVGVLGQVERGMIIDFQDLKVIIGECLQGLDHRCLNDTLPYPSVENLTLFLWDRIQEHLDRLNIKLIELEIWETSNCYAKLSEE